MQSEAFRTESLFAERLRPEDLSDLYRMNQDERVMAALGGVRTETQTIEYLQRNLEHWTQHGYGLWIFRDAAGNFVGRAGVRNIEINGRNELELGYALMSDYWGRGLATEVAKCLVDIAFSRLALAAMVILVLPDNLASRNVAEKTGGRFDGEINHAGLVHRIYRLVREEFLHAKHVHQGAS